MSDSDELSIAADALDGARQRHGALVGRVDELRSQLEMQVDDGDRQEILSDLHARHSTAETVARVAKQIASE